MTILSISAAATAAGIDRRTLRRAIKSGRLSAAVPRWRNGKSSASA